MKKFRWWIAPLLCVMLWGLPVAHAEDTAVSGTNLQFYQPALDPAGIFEVNGPRLLGAGDAHFKISQRLAFSHLLDVGIGTTVIKVVDRIYTTDFIASLGVNDFLTMGVDFPVHFYAREANVNSFASFTTRSVGDITMAMKFRLLEEKERRPGLALLFTNTFPSGNERKFLGTSHMVPGGELIVGKGFQHFSLALNLGARFPRQKTVLGQNFDDQVTYGGAIKVPFGVWDPHLAVIGTVRGHFEPNRLQIPTAPIQYAVGLQKEFRNGLAIEAGGGGSWNNAIGNPRMRGIVSISYSHPLKRHPDVCRPEEEKPEEVAVPPALPVEMREPEVAATGEEKETRRLEKKLARERARLEREELRRQAGEEALREKLWRRREEEEERALEEELQELKREAKEAEKKAWEKEAKEIEAEIACRIEEERKGQAKKETKLKGKELQKQIHTTVYFATGASRPSRESAQWVHEVADLLKRYPKVKKILVEGHTDSTGSAGGTGSRELNLRLSLRRAEAVKGMLVADGIIASRIDIAGLAADRPAAPNDTATGRTLNRRVEILVDEKKRP